MHLRQTHPTAAAVATERLQPRELLVLQLRARGYTRRQIAALRSLPADAVEQLEHSACAAMGVATMEEAVDLARRRRLIV